MLWTAIIWFIVWGTIGGIVTPRIYTRKDLDVSQASLTGTAIGAALGPIGLIPLWLVTPKLTTRMAGIAGLMVVGIFVYAFAQTYPENLCVVNGGFVASQLSNGIVIGIIYGLMALGLTLIYSILGVVSFAHGEFYMIGGMVVYYMSVSGPKNMQFWSPLASHSSCNIQCRHCSVQTQSKRAVFSSCRS